MGYCMDINQAYVMAERMMVRLLQRHYAPVTCADWVKSELDGCMIMGRVKDGKTRMVIVSASEVKRVG
jgi:hypothetical protein